MTAEMNLAHHLKLQLAQRGWNQSDLVRESGLDKNTVSGIVNAKQRASASSIAKIAQALNVSVESLLDPPVIDNRVPAEMPRLDEASDVALLAELARRLDRTLGGGQGAVSTPSMNDADDQSADYDDIIILLDQAARKSQQGKGRRLEKFFDQLGEENQDSEGK